AIRAFCALRSRADAIWLIAEVILRVFLTVAMRSRSSLRFAIGRSPRSEPIVGSALLEGLLERLHRVGQLGLDLLELLLARGADLVEQGGAVVLEPRVQLAL